MAAEADFDLDDLVIEDSDVTSLDVEAELADLGPPASSSTPTESTGQSGKKETLKPG